MARGRRHPARPPAGHCATLPSLSPPGAEPWRGSARRPPRAARSPCCRRRFIWLAGRLRLHASCPPRPRANSRRPAHRAVVTAATGGAMARHRLAEGAVSPDRPWARRAPRPAGVVVPGSNCLPAPPGSVPSPPPLSCVLCRRQRVVSLQRRCHRLSPLRRTPAGSGDSYCGSWPVREGKGGSSSAQNGGLVAGAAPEGMVHRRRADSPTCGNTPVNSARPPRGLPQDQCRNCANEAP